MTIGILLCGEIPRTLHPEFGTYGDMLTDLLGAREVRVFDIGAGERPAAADACDAYLVSGSEAGVHDPLPWIEELAGFLRKARGRAKLVGICFGHQLMAHAFGGTVETSRKGWGVGLHRYDVLRPAAWMDGAPTVAGAAAHQDQVVTAPPSARVVASSGFTPYAGLDYGDAVSFQFHPEFSSRFATALIREQRYHYEALADQAIRSHAEPDDRTRVAGWIGRFLDGGVADQRPVIPTRRG